MPAVSFDAGRPRAIRRGQRRYALVRDAGGRPAVVDATCRHRGGPLDLGDIACDAAGRPVALRCPWHQRCQTMRDLLRRALPAVIRDGMASTVIVPEMEEDA